MRTAKTLISLGIWSESSLGAHSFCWFYHVAAHISFRHVTKCVYLFCDWFPAIYMTEFILNWNTQVLSPIIYTNFLSSLPGDGLLISEWVTTKCVRKFEMVHVHNIFDRARWITPSISSFERQNSIELILQHLIYAVSLYRHFRWNCYNMIRQKTPV